jgi:hypothetical protein
MKSFQTNRRINRSNDTQIALSFQLVATAKRAKFGSIVLADDLGMVVAAAGPKNMCEQMAAVSPMLAAESKTWHGSVKTRKGRIRLSVAPIRVDSMQLYLCASQGDKALITRELFTGGQGISRILA